MKIARALKIGPHPRQQSTDSMLEFPASQRVLTISLPKVNPVMPRDNTVFGCGRPLRYPK
jgi:hypothetical protein